MTAREFLCCAEAALVQSACPDPKVDARCLLESALNVPFSRLRITGDFPLAPEVEARLKERLARRVLGEPLQYIEGFQEFMGLRMRADARALIPRQDTETLAEAAIAHAKALSAPSVLDLCTGSGAVALAIKKFVPQAEVAATDICEGALGLARENAVALGLEIEFLRGDLFSAACGRRFDVIASNPPYLSGADMNELQREVRHEPRRALFGGLDGLCFYRRIAAELRGMLKIGGAAFFEVGMGQAKAVTEIFYAAIPEAKADLFKDLSGIERVVAIYQ